MALTNPPLDLNLYMCAASLGSPMVALVLVPSDISRVNIFIRPPSQQIGDADATPHRASTRIEPTPPRGTIPSQPPGNTQKRPREPTGEQTEYPPAKQAKVEAGPSRLQVTGYPQQVSGGDDLLVLPPIPRDIYDELISSYDLLTSSYNDVNSSATEPETSEDEQERRRRMNIKHQSKRRVDVHEPNSKGQPVPASSSPRCTIAVAAVAAIVFIASSSPHGRRSRSCGQVILVFIAIPVVVASGPGLSWEWGSCLPLSQVPQQREEGDHNGTKEGAWCSSSSSPLRGGVTSGAVWIATDYGRETTGTASVLLTGSPISPRRTPILPPQRTAPPLLLPPRGQIPISAKVVFEGHHDDSKNNLASFVKAFPPANVIFTGIGVLLAVRFVAILFRTSEEATELSSTSLSLHNFPGETPDVVEILPKPLPRVDPQPRHSLFTPHNNSAAGVGPQHRGIDDNNHGSNGGGGDVVTATGDDDEVVRQAAGEVVL
ncbi:hypothetical protein EDB84DRAFT_1673277 [Lactarius hengduanensis]|nr:hypothetical protein EDB84DRAFT_1673277 [Lactarius hengduanensis]